MDYHTVSDVYSHMAGIADYISRLGLTIGNLLAHRPLVKGCSGHIISELLIYRIDKSGTVSAVCKACAAVNIRITNEFAGVNRNGFT